MDSKNSHVVELQETRQADWYYSEDRFPTMEQLDAVLVDFEEGGGRLPCEPLRRFLSGRSINSVARQMSARFGTNEQSEACQLWRLTAQKTKLMSHRAADRFAVGMGLHPSQIWAEWK